MIGLHVCACTIYMSDGCRGQKTVLDPLRLELETGVMWKLRIKCRSFRRATSNLNRWVISPAQNNAMKTYESLSIISQCQPCLCSKHLWTSIPFLRQGLTWILRPFCLCLLRAEIRDTLYCIQLVALKGQVGVEEMFRKKINWSMCPVVCSFDDVAKNGQSCSVCIPESSRNVVSMLSYPCIHLTPADPKG